MNTKIIVLCIFIVLSSASVSAYSLNADYSFDGDGEPHFPNAGIMWFGQTGASDYIQFGPNYICNATDNFYILATMSSYVSKGGSGCYTGTTTSALHLSGSGTSTAFVECSTSMNQSCRLYTSYYTSNSATGYRLRSYCNDKWGCSNTYLHTFSTVRFKTTPFETYNISGITGCIDYIEIYEQINNSYRQINYTTLSGTDTYTFEVINGYQYKLIFGGDHEYIFTVTGSDITYNYNRCSHTQYRFEENCGNLILDSEGYYIEKLNGVVLSANNFHAANGILDISNSSADEIYINTKTFVGNAGHLIDPVITDTTYNLTNNVISWDLKVIVQNESDGTLIDDAMVKVDQSCYCTSGYSTRQKLTVSGTTNFYDMSLQDASLFVMKSGYKIINENTTGYNAFLSGRHNFSSKTWIVKLAPSWSNNSSTFYEVTNTVNIFFIDELGNQTSKILDTDTEVYLYYENNNTDGDDMTLKFQSSSTHSYFIDELEWNIPYNTIGHKIISNEYFTPWDYSYRAIIYNSSIYGWNKTISLTVRNTTKEDQQHYENLSTLLCFFGAINAKIDYREDMDIVVHACSNNTTLMNVDIELWTNNVYTTHKNLTTSDFLNAPFQYYYTWEPSLNYVSGNNYTIRMYGFDRTLLETNYVECYTDATVRKNKLTILVKDKGSVVINGAFIFLEGFGSLFTGSIYYNSYEGLNNGTYRYTASKQGYTGTGWNTIVIADSDETVTYTLTLGATEGSGTPQKTSDADIQELFFPIMFMILIFILIGGLKYVL